MSISPQRRQEIIDALRRGTVPRNSLDAFATGLERFEPTLDEELRSVSSGGGKFKAIRGEYGCGKTFFARWLADRGAVLLANHGLLCVGKNPADVLKVSRLVERTAQLVWGAKLMGSPVPLPDSTLERFAPIYKMMGRLR